MHTLENVLQMLKDLQIELYKQLRDEFGEKEDAYKYADKIEDIIRGVENIENKLKEILRIKNENI